MRLDGCPAGIQLQLIMQASSISASFDVYSIAIVALRPVMCAQRSVHCPAAAAMKFEIDTQHQSHREIFASGI